MTDTYEMTRSERRTLKRIAQRISIQSHAHKENITEYVAIMKEAMRNEFTEDNTYTLNDFFDECVTGANK